MIARLEFDENEWKRSERLIRGLPETMQNRVWRPAWKAAATEIEDIATQPNYGFTDRSGLLRASISSGVVKKVKRQRTSNIQGNFYGGVLAGIEGIAPHAFLVEQGHGGPKPAPAHSYLERALREGIGKARRAFQQTAIRTFVRVMARERKKAGL